MHRSSIGAALTSLQVLGCALSRCRAAVTDWGLRSAAQEPATSTIWWSRQPLIEVVLSTPAVRLGFIGRSGPEHRRYPAESRRSRDGIRWYSVWSGSGHAGMARGGDCPLLSRRFGVDFADDGFLRPSGPECMLRYSQMA